MKKLFALLLTLAACSSGTDTVRTPVVATGEEPMKGGSPQMSTIGFKNSVDWECHQADYNENLIWIECKFQNYSFAPKRACIRVIISDAQDQEIDQSRVVCSKLMQKGESYENYASFTNTKHSRQRAAIQVVCGFDTSRCKMSTKIEPSD